MSKLLTTPSRRRDSAFAAVASVLGLPVLGVGEAAVEFIAWVFAGLASLFGLEDIARAVRRKRTDEDD